MYHPAVVSDPADATRVLIPIIHELRLSPESPGSQDYFSGLPSIPTIFSCFVD